jgi:hypothetical protein
VSRSVGAESAQLRFSASLDGFDLTVARVADSLTDMIRERALRQREKLLATLPITGELLPRESSKEMTVFDCRYGFEYRQSNRVRDLK